MKELRREVLRENEQHPEGMALMQRADLPAREGIARSLACSAAAEIDAAAMRLALPAATAVRGVWR